MIIGFSAIVLTISGVKAPFTDSPRKTSAPLTASAKVRAAVSAAKDELLVIPMNMRDGILICKGKAIPTGTVPHRMAQAV